MKTIKVKKENGKLVCDPTHTNAVRGEQITWVADGVGNDVEIRFREKSPFAETGPFRLADPHTISPKADKGTYKFDHIEGDIIIG